MSTIKVVNIQHPDSVDPNLVLQADGDTVFASGLTVSGTFDIANDLTVSGNTGIGTSSPTSKLHVVDTTTNLQLESTADSSSGKIDFIGKDASSNSYRTLTIDTNSTGQINIETDPDNGGYSTDKSIIFKQAGSEKARIDNSGNVGIGTTSPGAILDVEGAGQNILSITSTGAACKLLMSDGNTTGDIHLQTLGNDLRAVVNNSERVRIDSSGNVGINTSSPEGKLHVRADGNETKALLNLQNRDTGSNAASQIAFFNGGIDLSDNRYGYIRSLKSGSNGNFLTFGTNADGAAPGERMRIDSGGNVGIGTTSPDGRLHVSSTGTTRFFIEGSDGKSEIRANNGNLSFFANQDANASGLNTTVFYRNGANESMRIDSSGNVGIGTNSPAHELDVAGAIQSSSTIYGVTFAGTNDTNSFVKFPGSDVIEIRTGNTERMRIDASGNVGIGTNSPDVKLHILAGSSSGILLEDSSTSASAPDIEVIGKRSDGNASPSFGGKLLLAKNKTNSAINSTNSIGTILFGGNHTDGSASNIRYAASIGGVSEGTFSSSTNMPTGLAFYTGSTGYASTTTNIKFGTEQMRIDATGNVGISTTAPDEKLDVRGNIRAQTSGSSSGAEMQSGGALEIWRSDGIAFIDFKTSVSEDFDCRIQQASNGIAFATGGNGSSVERMRIHSGGQISVGTTSVNPGIANTVTGASINGDGYISASRDNPVAYFSRPSIDGQLVNFAHAGTSEGSISISGTTVSYNQFLGSHWAALTDWSRPEIKIGTILETINELTDWKYAAIEVEGEQKKICYNGTAAPGDTVSVEYEGEIYEGIVELETDPEFNKAVKVKVNDTAASKAVYGVFVGWNTDSDLDGGIWNDMYVGAVGNYVIRMAAGQDPEIGDLVESNGTGCGVVQDDDIIRTKTVAKITSTTPQVTYDDGSFLVTCVLYCG